MDDELFKKLRREKEDSDRFFLQSKELRNFEKLQKSSEYLKELGDPERFLRLLKEKDDLTKKHRMENEIVKQKRILKDYNLDK